ncbi:hypothetical protein [Chitinophaga sp. CF418]|uniref:hypothetical protein n=1 Tax=Chitinophaga sp. CF418 TaxID=1855287 RepID=UPI0009113A6B|nr:hypothetical protein [Chitinophaga sp. CF418]SHN42200.1 hypothetical protein SAMN05216311_114127 [Chitinophaga sp. CF418]
METIDFLYCENKDKLPGSGVILSAHPPYNIGKIYRFESSESLDIFETKHQVKGLHTRIHPYNIIVVYIGTIDKILNTIPPARLLTIEIVKELKQMAIFYEREKIKGNETRLKRYLRNEENN